MRRQKAQRRKVTINIQKRINFDKKYGILIFIGIKTSTVRLEKKAEEGDIIILTINKKDFAIAKVTDVTAHKFSDLSEETAYEDGFLSVASLKNALKKYYPSISKDSTVYQIKFSIIKIIDISLIRNDILQLCNIVLRQEVLSKNEKELLQKILLEGPENVNEQMLKKVKVILKHAYENLITKKE